MSSNGVKIKTHFSVLCLGYAKLAADAEQLGWKVRVYPVEVGCRGFAGKSTTRLLKVVGNVRSSPAASHQSTLQWRWTGSLLAPDQEERHYVRPRATADDADEPSGGVAGPSSKHLHRRVPTWWPREAGDLRLHSAEGTVWLTVGFTTPSHLNEEAGGGRASSLTRQGESSAQSDFPLWLGLPCFLVNFSQSLFLRSDLFSSLAIAGYEGLFHLVPTLTRLWGILHFFKDQSLNQRLTWTLQKCHITKSACNIPHYNNSWKEKKLIANCQMYCNSAVNTVIFLFPCAKFQESFIEDLKLCERGFPSPTITAESVLILWRGTKAWDTAKRYFRNSFCLLRTAQLLKKL